MATALASLGMPERRMRRGVVNLWEGRACAGSGGGENDDDMVD